MHNVILLVNAEHMYHLRRVPAANHAQSRSTAMTPALGLGLGLRSVSIRYSAPGTHHLRTCWVWRSSRSHTNQERVRHAQIKLSPCMACQRMTD